MRSILCLINVHGFANDKFVIFNCYFVKVIEAYCRSNLTQAVFYGNLSFKLIGFCLPPYYK